MVVCGHFSPINHWQSRRYLKIRWKIYTHQDRIKYCSRERQISKGYHFQSAKPEFGQVSHQLHKKKPLRNLKIAELCQYWNQVSQCHEIANYDGSGLQCGLQKSSIKKIVRCIIKYSCFRLPKVAARKSSRNEKIQYAQTHHKIRTIKKYSYLKTKHKCRVSPKIRTKTKIK